MAEHLIIRCKLDESVDWLIEADGQIKASGNNAALNTIEVPVGHYKIYLLVPTELVGLHQVNLPKMSPARLLQAVPFALEDQFVDDIQNLHFAVGAIQKNKPLTVAAIKKDWLETWLARFKDQGLHINALIPEVFALPYEADHWTVLLTSEMGYVRTGAEQGFATDPETLLMLLEMNLGDDAIEQPSAIDLYSAETSPTLQEAFIKHGIALNEYTFNGDLLTFFASQLRLHPPTFNILQGAYRAGHETSRLKKVWLMTGICLLAWVTASFGFALVERAQLNHQATQLNTQIKALYQKNFPKSGAMEEPQVQMQARLNSLKNTIEGGPFLSLLGKAGNVIHASPGVQIKNLTYQTNEMDLTLEVDTFNHLQSLVQQLTAAGLIVNQTSAQANNKGAVEAQLTLKSTGTP